MPRQRHAEITQRQPRSLLDLRDIPSAVPARRRCDSTTLAMSAMKRRLPRRRRRRLIPWLTVPVAGALIFNRPGSTTIFQQFACPPGTQAIITRFVVGKGQARRRRLACSALSATGRNTARSEQKLEDGEFFLGLKPKRKGAIARTWRYVCKNNNAVLKTGCCRFSTAILNQCADAPPCPATRASLSRMATVPRTMRSMSAVPLAAGGVRAGESRSLHHLWGIPSS